MTPEELALPRSPSYAADRKALDIVQLDLRGIVGYADYFVICTGRSDRQMQGDPRRDPPRHEDRARDCCRPRVEGVTGGPLDPDGLPRRGRPRVHARDRASATAWSSCGARRRSQRIGQPRTAGRHRTPDRRPMRRPLRARQQLRRDFLLAAHHAGQLDVLSVAARPRSCARPSRRRRRRASSVPLLEHVGDHQRVERQVAGSRAARRIASQQLLACGRSSASPTTSTCAMQIVLAAAHLVPLGVAGDDLLGVEVGDVGGRPRTSRGRARRRRASAPAPGTRRRAWSRSVVVGELRITVSDRTAPSSIIAVGAARLHPALAEALDDQRRGRAHRVERRRHRHPRLDRADVVVVEDLDDLRFADPDRRSGPARRGRRGSPAGAGATRGPRG